MEAPGLAKQLGAVVEPGIEKVVPCSELDRTQRTMNVVLAVATRQDTLAAIPGIWQGRNRSSGPKKKNGGLRFDGAVALPSFRWPIRRESGETHDVQDLDERPNDTPRVRASENDRRIPRCALPPEDQKTKSSGRVEE